MRSTLPTFNEVWQRQFRSGVLTQFDKQQSQQKFLIGCSGGMDSMLLLHLMAELYPKRVRAIYVDHQLQQPSAEWGQLVLSYCEKMNLPCVLQAVNVETGNLEQQARHARYAAYQQHLASDEILVLAHHQQDQAETFLLRLFSGAGVQGLSAMKAMDVRENLTIWRPLLNLSREQIEQWTTQLQLDYVTDPSNHDTHYDRAWCRQQLWPLLTARFPKMQQAVARSSSLMQDADEILSEVLAQDWQYCATAKHIDLVKLQTLSAARQRQLLSAWMRAEAAYRPALEMVLRVQAEVIEAEQDRQAALHWAGYYYVRYQQQLFRLSQQEYRPQDLLDSPQQIQLCNTQSFVLAAGQFTVQRQQKIGLSEYLLQQDLTLTRRQGGEKIHLYGRVGSWPLKKAIQDAKIYPWQRHTIQILSIDNVMLGVFTPQGFWLAQSAYCVADGWLPKLV